MEATTRLYHWLYENSYMAFATNNAERMRILATGDIGIGTDAFTNNGGNKLSIDSATNAAPATSGTTQSGGALRLRGGDNAVLDFGLNSVNAWIQATDKVNLANGYKISLNPNGGNVGVGTGNPSELFHVQHGTSNAKILIETLKELRNIRIPLPKGNFKHAWYKFHCYLNKSALLDGWDRDRILDEINQYGYPAFAGSCSEIYLEKCFKNSEYRYEQRLLNAKELGETSLMFLIHPL